MATADRSTPALYLTMERVMEEKALAVGGKNMRRAFFQYLQKMRDKSRREHGPCSTFFRAWIADKRTWEHFFPYERFVGIEPVGADIHHCKYLKPASISSSVSDLKKSQIILQGAGQHKFDCSDSEMKNFAHIFLIDNGRSRVEEAMQCQLHVHASDDVQSLKITITPDVDNLHPAILRMATNVLLDWIRLTLKNPYKLSRFWTDWSYQNLDSHKIISSRNSPPQSPATEQDTIPNKIPIFKPAGIMESEWQKFADAFGCSYVDQVVIEGQVKAEASLRLVLDRDTGDVVTLEEFEKRILMREQTKLKRKVDGVGEIKDNSRSEKKLCFQF